MTATRCTIIFGCLVLTIIPGPAPAQDKSEKPRPAPKTTAKPSSPKPTPAGKTKKTDSTANASAPGPQVMSKEAALAKRPRSIFLAPPGSSSSSDRQYGEEETDWSEIPPWRLASFFGIHARGQFFVYVVDQSGSMLDDDRLIRAKIELRRSVSALRQPQRFEVIFYNEEATPMPGGPLPRPADQRNKNLLASWLGLIGPDGETEPRSAVIQAVSLRPDAVFLLSDGEFPEGTAEAIARANKAKIPIHCVDLSGGEAGDHLKRIARDSGGQYASRPGSLQSSP